MSNDDRDDVRLANVTIRIRGDLMSVRCRFGDAVYETRIPEVHPEVVRRLLELQRVVEKKLGPVPEELFK